MTEGEAEEAAEAAKEYLDSFEGQTELLGNAVQRHK